MTELVEALEPASGNDVEGRISQNTPDVELPERSFTFDRSDLCVIAALNHCGLAIGRQRLIQQGIDRGELVLPFGAFSQRTQYNYYLVHPPAPDMPLRTSVFMSWLSEKANDKTQ